MVKYSAYFDNKPVLEVTPGDEPIVEVRIYDTFSGISPGLAVTGNLLRLVTTANVLALTEINSTLTNRGIMQVALTDAATSGLASGKQPAQLEIVRSDGKAFVIPLPGGLNVRPTVF